ncbi:MAG: hypothetical protein A3205_04435 [Methanomassiliicoccales archaeon Mx-03]|nr:MAG: hypothetical protein A3205_04435 [Methanomassiliicoccales archaeon Mx-03]
MNTKAIAITAAVLAALLGVFAVAHVDDVDAAGNASDDPIIFDGVEVGVGYEGTTEGAQFSAKISEQAYGNENTYKVIWTITYDDGDQDKTWRFTYFNSGSITAGDNNPSDDLKISMQRGGMGYYTIEIKNFESNTADTEYTFNITSQIVLTIGGVDLVLNTNYFEAPVTTYYNVLADPSVIELTAETNVSVPVSITGDSGKTIVEGDFSKYSWYATRLPAGLTLNNGYISGMPVDATSEDGKNAVLVVRDITGDNPGREYYGTLNVKVKAFVDPTYGITITTTEGGKLVGGNLSYVAVNGAQLTLNISGANFNGKATVINSETGIRTNISIDPPASQDVSQYYGTIPVDGVGTYIVKVVWDGGSRDITLRVVAQTAGTSGAGFVVVGN